MKVLKIPTIEELKEIDLSYMKTISEESGVVPQSVIDTELLEPPGCSIHCMLIFQRHLMMP